MLMQKIQDDDFIPRTDRYTDWCRSHKAEQEQMPTLLALSSVTILISLPGSVALSGKEFFP